jgi:hypothetical protein
VGTNRDRAKHWPGYLLAAKRHRARNLCRAIRCLSLPKLDSSVSMVLSFPKIPSGGQKKKAPPKRG